MRQAQQHASLIERSKQEALLLAAPMIERTVEAGLDALAEAERSSRSVPRRMQLNEAWASLSRHASTLHTGFPSRMLKAIERALSEGQIDPEQNTAVAHHDEESILGLLDDAEVARFVEASRLQQTALPVVEHILNELDSLISSAQGLPVVRAERNPFRPEIICDVLLQQLRELPEPDGLRSHWLRHMSEPFAHELHQLYQTLVRMLTGAGVEEARYRLKLAPSVGARGGSGHAAPTTETGPTPQQHGAAIASNPTGTNTLSPANDVQPMPSIQQLSRGQPAIHPAVMHSFLYQAQWTEAHDQTLGVDYYNAVQAELDQMGEPVETTFDPLAHAEMLRQQQAQNPIERQRPTLNVNQSLVPDLWGELASAQSRTRTLMQLKAKATRLSQVLGLDAVRLLINQVASDVRILPPLREAFIALEPALLRTALSDPRFFGNEQHPARLLMEAVAQRSFKHNDEFDPDFQAFMEPVRTAVHQLNKLPTAHPQDYQNHRNQLQKNWDQEDRSEEKEREQIIGSMAFAQERQLLADRIAWEFSLRSDLVGVPAVIADFLYRDWSLVLAHAQLTQAGPTLDPGGYLAVVSDLLWSVNSSLAIKEPTRLFDLLPNLLETLRRGLDMLGKESEETQAFFDALLRFHSPVLRLRRLRSAHDIQASGLAPLDSGLDALVLPSDQVLAEAPKPLKADQPWLGRREREAAGFEESITDSLDDGTAPSRATLEHSQPIPPASAHSTPEPPPQIDADLSIENAGPDSPAESRPDALDPALGLAVEDLSDGELLKHIRAEVARLRKGDWADLYVQGAWRRAQLSWTSDNAALFMFISQGGRAHSMTRRSCEKLMSKGHMIPVDIHPVIERALRELAAAEQPSDPA